MALASERCEPCRGSVQHLDDGQVAALAVELGGAWEVHGHDRLSRIVETDDFAASLALAVRIGCLAEGERHHPDLRVSWARLEIDLTTHAAKGLTRNDFVLAAKIDRLLAS